MKLLILTIVFIPFLIFSQDLCVADIKPAGSETDTESGLSIIDYKKKRAMKGLGITFLTIGYLGVASGFVWFILGVTTAGDMSDAWVEWDENTNSYVEKYSYYDFHYWGKGVYPSWGGAILTLIPGHLLIRKVRKNENSVKKISVIPSFNPLNKKSRLSLCYSF